MVGNDDVHDRRKPTRREDRRPACKLLLRKRRKVRSVSGATHYCNTGERAGICGAELLVKAAGPLKGFVLELGLSLADVHELAFNRRRAFPFAMRVKLPSRLLVTHSDAERKSCKLLPRDPSPPVEGGSAQKGKTDNGRALESHVLDEMGIIVREEFLLLSLNIYIIRVAV